MKKNQHRLMVNKRFFTAVIVLILGVMACGISTGAQEQAADNLVETSVALERTQATLDNLIESLADPGEQEQPTVPTATTEPTPEVIKPEPEEPPAPIPSPDFSFEGISFSYDETVLRGVTANVIEGRNMGEEMMPIMTYPTHILFEFDPYLLSHHFYTPAIRVYPVEAYENISEMATSTVAKLKKAFIDRPGGGMFTSLPSMPLWGAPTLLTTQVRYFDFQDGSGMRFLAMFGQDLFPPDNQNLIYIFQGITDDDQHYLSAVFPITHPGLPDDGYAEITDWEQFYEEWDDLCEEALKLLDEAVPGSFSPTLEHLDMMMASFKIER